MQLLAMISMLVDHVGLLFFPDQSVWRMIGRLAFPIYAYFLVLGYRRTSNVYNYLLRLAVIGAVSQVPYFLVMDSSGINVVGTLFVSLAILHLLNKPSGTAHKAAVVSAAALLLEAFPFDYGAYGLLLCLIYRYASSHQTVMLHALLNLLFVTLKGWTLTTLSVVSTLLIVYSPMLCSALDRLRIPGWLWRSFYPAHLALLAIVYSLISMK